MKKETEKLKKDRAWFEQKVGELISEVEKLPADRREELKRELETGSEPAEVEE